MPFWTLDGLVSWLECQTKMSQMSYDSSGPDTENGGGGNPKHTKPQEALPIQPFSAHSRSSMEGGSGGQVR